MVKLILEIEKSN